MKILKILIVTYLISNNLLLAKECRLDYSILYLIAMNEKHKSRQVGYPYLISFNKKSDLIKAKKLHIDGFLDTRTIDCKNKQKCVKTTRTLIKNKMHNLDLGAFQINYTYHKMSIEDYFDFQKEYKKSCEIAQNFIDPDNITFKDIARYNSSTKNINERYAKNLQINYNKLIKGIK